MSTRRNLQILAVGNVLCMQHGEFACHPLWPRLMLYCADERRCPPATVWSRTANLHFPPYRRSQGLNYPLNDPRHELRVSQGADPLSPNVYKKGGTILVKPFPMAAAVYPPPVSTSMLRKHGLSLSMCTVLCAPQTQQGYPSNPSSAIFLCCEMLPVPDTLRLQVLHIMFCSTAAYKTPQEWCMQIVNHRI